MIYLTIFFILKTEGCEEKKLFTAFCPTYKGKQSNQPKALRSINFSSLAKPLEIKIPDF